jgi:hypothetical protein
LILEQQEGKTAEGEAEALYIIVAHNGEAWDRNTPASMRSQGLFEYSQVTQCPARDVVMAVLKITLFVDTVSPFAYEAYHILRVSTS